MESGYGSPAPHAFDAARTLGPRPRPRPSSVAPLLALACGAALLMAVGALLLPSPPSAGSVPLPHPQAAAVSADAALVEAAVLQLLRSHAAVAGRQLRQAADNSSSAAPPAQDPSQRSTAQNFTLPYIGLGFFISLVALRYLLRRAASPILVFLDS